MNCVEKPGKSTDSQNGSNKGVKWTCLTFPQIMSPAKLRVNFSSKAVIFPRHGCMITPVFEGAEGGMCVA